MRVLLRFENVHFELLQISVDVIDCLIHAILELQCNEHVVNFLADGGALRAHRLRGFAELRRRLAEARNDMADDFAGSVDQRAVLVGVFARDLERLVDCAIHRFHGTGNLLAGFGRKRRQLAHLVGDDGKAATDLTGTRRFDRRVERQEIRLVGDVADVLCHLAQCHRVAGELSDFLHQRRLRRERGLHLADDRIEFLLGLLQQDEQRFMLPVAAAVGLGDRGAQAVGDFGEAPGQ